MKRKTPSVSFVVLGYVGLCTAAVFALRGVEALGIDIDKEKLGNIARGTPLIHEPQLKQTLRKILARRRLEVTDDISEAARTDTTFITIGTPSPSSQCR